jgi:hypothetical protein
MSMLFLGVSAAVFYLTQSHLSPSSSTELNKDRIHCLAVLLIFSFVRKDHYV